MERVRIRQEAYTPRKEKARLIEIAFEKGSIDSRRIEEKSTFQLEKDKEE